MRKSTKRIAAAENDLERSLKVKKVTVTLAPKYWQKPAVGAVRLMLRRMYPEAGCHVRHQQTGSNPFAAHVMDEHGIVIPAETKLIRDILVGFLH